MPAKRKKSAKRSKTAKRTKPAKKSPSRSTKKRKRWAAERLLSEARVRTRRIGIDAKPDVQRMLAALLDEAGWTRAQFVRALVKDVQARLL